MKRGKDACDTPRLNARRFEELVVEKIRSNILTEGSITELVKVVDEEMDGIAQEQRKRLRIIEDELEDVKRRLGRIWNAIETSDIEMADASDRIKEHRERKERLEDAAADARAILSERRAHLDDVKTISAYAKDMRDFLNESELTERRSFIESFVKEIIVIPGDALIRYTVPMPDDSFAYISDLELNYVDSSDGRHATVSPLTFYRGSCDRFVIGRDLNIGVVREGLWAQVTITNPTEQVQFGELQVNIRYPNGDFRRILPDQGCYGPTRWSLSVPPGSNVTHYVPVFPDPATLGRSRLAGDPTMSLGEYLVFIRFQEQFSDEPDFVVTVQPQPVGLPDNLSAGVSAFWKFPEHAETENSIADAYSGLILTYKALCNMVEHCVDPFVLIPFDEEPLESLRQASRTAARAEIETVDASHNQTRVRTEWINRTVYWEMCHKFIIQPECATQADIVRFDRATAKLIIATPATAEFPTIQNPQPGMTVESYEENSLKHNLVTWWVYGVDKRLKWNEPYKKEIRINHSADIEASFGVSLEMGPYRGNPY